MSDGSYTIRGLDAKNYRVRFYDSSGNFASEYYENASSLETAADIEVEESGVASGIDVSLEQAGRITGTVTAADGVTPLRDISIEVYRWDESELEWVWSVGTATEINGDYSVSGLSAGIYTVQFYDDEENYQTEYYNNSPNLSEAQNIPVGFGSTVSGINASLAELSKISGTITGPDGVTPLEDIQVRAYFWNAEWEEWDYDDSYYSDSDGRYTIRGLAARNYRIRFYDSDGQFATEYYNNAPDLESAADIVVGSSTSVAGVNASLAESSKITGTVTGPDGTTPLEDIQVRAYYWDDAFEYWEYDVSSYTSEDGRYSIYGLSEGSYRIRFYDGSGNYLTEYYDNAVDVTGADDIEVGTSVTVSGIDASLAQAGKIAGTITGPDGTTPLEDVYVEVYQWSTAGEYWQWVSDDYTRSDGTYSAGGLRAGAYRIHIDDESGDYVDEYYHNASDLDSAADIVVADGATVGGINVSLSEGGTITGRITARNGTSPLEDIRVTVYYWYEEDETWESLKSVETDQNGNYSARGLASGVYRLRFYDYDETYLTEYYNNAPDLDSAADIVVGNLGTVSGIDASLAPGGKITGIITGPDGTTPLEDIEVRVYYLNEERNIWYSDTYSQTTEVGRYTISGLFPRRYRIEISDPEENYAREYYNNVWDLSSATDVVVADGATVGGINASLALAGKITGTITGPDGTTPLEGIEVRASYWNEERSTWYSDRYTQTSQDGRYTITGLFPRVYRIEISDQNGNYIAEYYNDVSNLAFAEDIPVASATTVSGINASLSEGGAIAGRITGPDGTSPLEGINVVAYYWHTGAQYWAVSQNVYTDEDGDYSLRGLKAGTYRLGFHNTDDTYLTEYYNDKQDISSAEDITISGVTTISGINASMDTEAGSGAEATVSGFRKTGPGAYAMDFKGENGHYYQLQSSGTLGNWIDVGAPFMAGSGTVTIPVSSSESKMFWRIHTVD